MKKYFFGIIFLVLLSACDNGNETVQLVPYSTLTETIESLTEIHGLTEADRIDRGVKHAAGLWFKEDGSVEDFKKFCIRNFASGQKLDEMFEVLGNQLELIHGHNREISLGLDLPIVTHQREIMEIDRLIARSKPAVDFYKSKLAFSIALNFPFYSNDEKNDLGKDWNRKKWAMVRLGDRFKHRSDPSIKVNKDPIDEELREYTKLYILSMDQMLTSDMQIVFPEGTRLNSHNGLRDEVKGLYTRKESLQRQELISSIVMHIVNQTIPACMIGETEFFWEPESNKVYKKKDKDYLEVENVPEPNNRYKVLHYNMKSRMLDDQLYSDGSTHISRVFDSRQLSEQRVVDLLESVLASDAKYRVAEILRQRLGRDLQPFDIWYPGFQSQSNYDMDELDKLIREKYYSPIAFQNDIENILGRIGFEPEIATFLGSHVVVDPIPSGGHANGPQMKNANAHLRTRFEPYGLNYKGYRIGMHEIGHTIEQNISMDKTDYYFLKGIPSSPFTEAMADLIAYRDVVGLGVSSEYSQKDRELNALAAFWFICEMGAEAIHEIRVWHWFYENPDATVLELKEATIKIASEIWNKYFSEIYGVKDIPILSIYNHFIGGGIYLHSYPLGNIVLMQLEEYFKDKDFASEMINMCTIGKLTPDLWMIEATGKPFTSEPVLNAVNEALKNYEN